MNKERLLNVAKALRESPDPAKFTMSVVSHACGTPGCAIGHYVARPDLQNEFRPIPPSDTEHMGDRGTGWVSLTDGSVIFFSSTRLMDHFDLDEEAFGNLFDGDEGCGCAMSATQAAEYIECFVAEHE